jgi:Kae1-associated kinase Bud32
LFKTGNTVVKDRFSKSYRHPVLDSKLRKFRTKREAKVLQKLKELNFPASSYIDHDEKDMKLTMKFISGDVLKTVFDGNHEVFSKMIGKNLALMHKNGIIHGDLTTSNMIFNKELHFIDFGLSFFSDKYEDKAVDLHLLKEALESKHHAVVDSAFKIVLDSYNENYSEADSVIKRLEIVEKRGRYKQQY